MSGEHNPLFSDPALMRVNPQVASQPADGSPPRYGSAIAPEGTAFHSATTALRARLGAGPGVETDSVTQLSSDK